MNYNILCDKYATRHVYGYCPSWALKWDYRRKQILDELRSYSADIIALQVRDRGKRVRKRNLNIDVNSRKWRPISSIRSFCLNYKSRATMVCSVRNPGQKPCVNKIVAMSMDVQYSIDNRSKHCR